MNSAVFHPIAPRAAPLSEVGILAWLRRGFF